MRVDQLKAIALEQQDVRVVGAERLPLEDEARNPADQILDAGMRVWPQFDRAHSDSFYRRNQELVKHWKKFSNSPHRFLG